MAQIVLFEILDGRGLPVEVTERGWSHILEGHPEMLGEEEAIRLTVSDPDIVVRPPPRQRARGRGIERRINARLGAHSRHSQLWLWVPIDYAAARNWVVTAYPNMLPPKGELLYVRLPTREL